MTRDNIPIGSTASMGGATPHPIPSLLFASVSQLLQPCVSLIISLVIILAVQYARSPWRKVPPGPKGLPVLGNVRQFQDKSWLLGKDCKRQFGAFNFAFANAGSRDLCETSQNTSCT